MRIEIYDCNGDLVYQDNNNSVLEVLGSMVYLESGEKIKNVVHTTTYGDMHTISVSDDGIAIIEPDESEEDDEGDTV